MYFGYNSINFDEEFLRRTFYKNLFPPFLTSTNNFGISNKRGDVINLARSANYFFPGTLKTSFNEKGKEIFKLDQLASDNISSDKEDNLKFHDALDDTRATISIAKLIKKKAPILWESGLKTTYYLRNRAASKVEKSTGSSNSESSCSIEAAKNGDTCESCQ